MDDSNSDSLTSDHSSELRLCSSAARDASPLFGGGGGSSSARYKLMSPAKLPISRSSCITIPPGLSPTSFLESPVLLSNMKAEPSPTTGSFMNPQLWHSGSTGFSLSANCSRNEDDERRNDFFEFKPHALNDSVSGLLPGAAMKSPGTNNLRSEPRDQLHTRYQSQQFTSINTKHNEMTSCENESSHPLAIVPAGINSEEINQEITSATAVQASPSDHKDIENPVTPDRSSDDGYNWRKYGQKIVKGSEFPRSYYKCTHPNCEVKKIFERSYEGKITEIVYKGTHDHPKPQPARRFTGAIMSIQESTDHASSLVSGEVKSAMYGLYSRNNDPNGTPQLSPRGTNDNCLEGTTQNGNNDEGEEDDQFSKRRKLDEMSADVTAVVKPIREPRVVVQTVSEVDILDDGYRWRKYGQKVVRGNPNPRSYYKCTNVGCPVRKHVERASHDPKAVITTYEGKHNHDVPTARNSSHDMAGPGPGPRPANNITQFSRVRPDGNDSISLDLGVGISPVSENRSQFQTNRAGSNYNIVQMSPMSAYYGVVNGGSYITRDNQITSHNFQNTNMNHSSNQYPQNMEGVPLGP